MYTLYVQEVWSFLHSEYTMKIGQDFLDLQYIHFIFHCSAVRCLTRAHRFPAGNLVNYLNFIEVSYHILLVDEIFN